MNPDMANLITEHRARHGDLLTINEAARTYLIRPGTIRQWINRGQLPTIMIAGRLHIHTRDLADCERQRRQAKVGPTRTLLAG